jgi:L-threonylcarbamoyladenylate synthase
MTPVYSSLEEAIPRLLASGIGVIPTDTIYGLSGLALNKEAVERIYTVRERNKQKPLIVLIASIEDLKLFSVAITMPTHKLLNKYWPGPVSIILPVNNPDLTYLHRDTNSIAFRLPSSLDLKHLLEQTGPLVSTSANLQDEPVATTIQEAQNYFKATVDFYIDGGSIIGKSSTLYALDNDTGEVKTLRP